MTRVPAMGRTNIRKAWDLIQRAGATSQNEIAVIPELDDLPIHIFCRNFTQDELNYFDETIVEGCKLDYKQINHNDRWMVTKQRVVTKWTPFSFLGSMSHEKSPPMRNGLRLMTALRPFVYLT